MNNMLIIDRLNSIVSEINDTLKGSYLNRIECLDEYDYIFRFSRSKSKSIFISLNVRNPFVVLLDKKYTFSYVSNFYTKLKTKLLNSCLLSASTLNNDNILVLEFLKTTDTYDKMHYKLVFEIFKSNSNLILLKDNKIEEAFRFKGIDTHHPVVKNMTYEPPVKLGNSKELLEKDINYYENYIDNIEQTYLLNKYKVLVTEIKRRLKSLNKKLEKIEVENQEAKRKLIYKDYGDYFLTILSEVKRGESSFDYFGSKVKINETYSPSDNLNYLYKTYKKAKLTIQSTEEYILKTKDEISYLNSILSTIDILNDDDYQELILELTNRKILKIKGQKKPKNLKNAAKPYYIVFNGIRIGFGKNSLQNDTLTFEYAKKDDYFLHIKNNHGNHIIIFDSNPSDEVIKFALQFCVYLSKQTDGEVIYAKVKTIKKGNVEGLVKLSKYESYYIKNLEYDFSTYLKGATRF